MNKLRLTIEEKELLMKAIRDKLELDHKGPITTFEFSNKEVKEFLKDLEAEEINKPTLLIDAVAYTKMYELVKQSPIELQWHMLIERDLEANVYYLYDILLFPQTNSGTSTTTDQDEFAKWQTELIKDPKFPLEQLRGHGHSHVNMAVYSSGIDDAYQRDLITKVKDGDYYLFLVLNKKMEMFALLYDFNQQVIFETKDIDIQITTEDFDIRTWCAEQIKTYCKSYTSKYRPCVSYTPPNTGLKIDTYNPKEDELISEIKEAKKNFTKRRKKK